MASFNNMESYSFVSGQYKVSDKKKKICCCSDLVGPFLEMFDKQNILSDACKSFFFGPFHAFIRQDSG